MEIVHVSGYYPPHRGAEELVAQRLATIQAETNDVTVYTSAVGEGSVPGEERHGRLVIVRDRAPTVGNTPILPYLRRRLLRHRPAPELFHVHTGLSIMPSRVSFGAGRAALALMTRTLQRVAASLGVPYVVHLHLVGRSSPGARFLRRAALVICPTDSARDEAIARFGLAKDKVTVVPTGVDVDVFRPPVPGERRKRELLFVGELSARSNVMLAIEAMAHLSADVTLRVVGTGELREKAMRLIRAKSLTNVELVGHLAQPELAASYRRATAVVIPAARDALPMVLLEAMASGTPVICSERPEPLDVGGDAVVPFSPLTARQLAITAADLLGDDPARERISLAARRRSYLFTWHSVSQAIDEAYQRVIKDRE